MRLLRQGILALALLPAIAVSAQPQTADNSLEVILEPIPASSPEHPVFPLSAGEADPLGGEEVVIAQQPENVDSEHSLNQFRGYRVSESVVSWIAGNGNQFGMFSFASDHYASSGVESGVGIGIGIHLLAGPDQTDMPPRVYDFSIGYQKRDTIGDFSYDISFAVNAASDFEGSSRDGIQFPSHAVGYLALTDRIDLVLGADYLDREDVRFLPVGGLILRPDPDIRIELVFPSPRIDIQLTQNHRLYLNGGIGGGTWAVERDSEFDDLASYFDLRIGVGLERLEDDGDWSAIEVAYLFDRKLEYSSGSGSYRPNGTAMIRLVTTY